MDSVITCTCVAQTLSPIDTAEYSSCSLSYVNFIVNECGMVLFCFQQRA